uniref:Uncharacterized protein n=1 Tax=Phytophthora ramorum TaxID=164328 RepID=H3GFU8_PHYRM
MPEGRGPKKAGRGGSGRGEASRQSRRVQGLPAEEHKDLDTISREARAARKAARESEAAQGGDAMVFPVQDQPVAEPQTQDDQDSSRMRGSTNVSRGLGMPGVPEEHTREGGAQASEGGVELVEPPEVVDLVSESSVSDDVVEVKRESVRVKEEEKTQDAAVYPDSPPLASEAPAPNPDVLPKLESRTDAQGVSSGALAAVAEDVVLDGERAVMYVRREVRRWEELHSGRIAPPNVDFAWPTPRPDVNTYFEAAFATGDYFKWRSSMESQDDAWISEVNPVRWGVGAAQDLTAIQIPPTMLTSRECVVVLQTLLFEAGFEFSNLIPEWSKTHVSRIPDDLVRSVTSEVQACLAVELMEWRQVIAGVRFKVIPFLEEKPASRIQEQSPRLEYHTQDAQGGIY